MTDIPASASQENPEPELVVDKSKEGPMNTEADIAAIEAARGYLARRRIRDVDRADEQYQRRAAAAPEAVAVKAMETAVGPNRGVLQVIEAANALPERGRPGEEPIRGSITSHLDPARTMSWRAAIAGLHQVEEGERGNDQLQGEARDRMLDAPLPPLTVGDHRLDVQRISLTSTTTAEAGGNILPEAKFGPITSRIELETSAGPLDIAVAADGSLNTEQGPSRQDMDGYLGSVLASVTAATHR